MLFSRENIDISLILFREQIKSLSDLPFNKLSTIDCLFSSIFFEKEVGAIKALANKQLVSGHFTIPRAIEEFKKRSCDISVEQLKSIIFNSLAPIFNEVEPSSLGFSHCNKANEGFYWFQHYSCYKSNQIEINDTKTCHLYLKHTSGLEEIHSLVGQKSYPVFDMHTAELYCSLFNDSMCLNLEKLPNFDGTGRFIDINKSAYTSIFMSLLIANELVKLILSGLISELNLYRENNSDIDTVGLAYSDYLELIFNEVEVNDFANAIEDIISESLWEIKRKFSLLGNKSLSNSLAIELFSSKAILMLTIPSRVNSLECVGFNNSLADFVEAAILGSIYEIKRSLYPAVRLLSTF